MLSVCNIICEFCASLVCYTWRVGTLTILDDLGSNPGRDKRVRLFPKSPDRLWVLSSFLENGQRGVLSPLVNRRGGGGLNGKTSSRVEVKNEWKHTSASPTCLHGMHRDNFTFLTRDLVNLRLLNYSGEQWAGRPRLWLPSEAHILFRGTVFDSVHRCRLSWLETSVVFSVNPVRCWDNPRR
jgi:hypothetical protein